MDVRGRASPVKLEGFARTVDGYHPSKSPDSGLDVVRRTGFDEGVKAKSDFDSDLLRVPSSGFRVKGTRFRQGNTASADSPVGSRPGDTNKFTMFTRSMSGVQDTPTHLRTKNELTADCAEQHVLQQLGKYP